jgi:hypothetical protein
LDYPLEDVTRACFAGSRLDHETLKFYRKDAALRTDLDGGGEEAHRLRGRPRVVE